MIPFERVEIIRERLERAVGRLPRPVAYALIFVYSVAVWSAIGVAIGSILRRFAP